MKKQPVTTGADRAEARFRKALEDGVKRCGPIPALADTRQSRRYSDRKAAKRAMAHLEAGKRKAQLEAMRRVASERLAASKSAELSLRAGVPVKFIPAS